MPVDNDSLHHPLKGRIRVCSEQPRQLCLHLSGNPISAATAHGQSGLGIYAGGFLEAVYTGSNLNKQQLTGIVTGDGSDAAFNNTQGFYGV